MRGLHESSVIGGTTTTNDSQVESVGEDEEDVYEKALEHWTSIASDEDGMLGGFAQLHIPDITASRQFLTSLKNSKLLLTNERALDCGSGIGRVTKHLLLPAFQRVDMVDFSETFLLNSRKYIGDDAFRRVGDQFADSLHVFQPAPNRYDLIWMQWVTGHLTDADFVAFLKRCSLALRKGGCIVIKDNIASGATKDFDTEDHSWTRPKADFYKLFRKSRVDVAADRRQLNFPKGIYEVRMFALRPRPTSDSASPSSSSSYDEDSDDEDGEEEESASTSTSHSSGGDRSQRVAGPNAFRADTVAASSANPTGGVFHARSGSGEILTKLDDVKI